jgi:hypothetical protein
MAHMIGNDHDDAMTASIDAQAALLLMGRRGALVSAVCNPAVSSDGLLMRRSAKPSSTV